MGKRDCRDIGRFALLCACLLLDGRASAAQSFDTSEFRTLFQNVVLKHEYEGSDGKPLMRWEVPVTLSVQFGASVSPQDRAIDLKSVGKVTHVIAATTRHSLNVTQADGNFYLFVVSKDELAKLAPVLQAAVGLSAGSAMAITRLPRNTNCLVVALPERDKTKGYRNAVAVVRSDLSAQGRESCFYEELAQGMGLPDDCTERPTIFNDDGEFSQFTTMDIAMMRVTYDRRLRSGMPPEVVMHLLDDILRSSS